MKDTFYLILKREDGSEYTTVNTTDVFHSGDPIYLGGEKWIVVKGGVIPIQR